MVTLIKWFVERQKNFLLNKPDLTEYYSDLMKNEPELIKKALLENLDYDIALAINSGHISEDFKIDKNNKKSFVEEIFNALKDEFVKD